MKKVILIIVVILNLLLAGSYFFMYSQSNKLDKKLSSNESINNTIEKETKEKEGSVASLEENYNNLKTEKQDKLDLLEGFKTWKVEIEQKMAN